MYILSEYRDQLIKYNRQFSELRFHPERTFDIEFSLFRDLGESLIKEIGNLILKSIGSNSHITETYALENFEDCYQKEYELFDNFQLLINNIQTGKYSYEITGLLGCFLDEMRDTLLHTVEDINAKLYYLIIRYFSKENSLNGQIEYVKNNAILYRYANKTHFKENYPMLKWGSEFPLNSIVAVKKEKKEVVEVLLSLPEMWLVEYFETDNIEYYYAIHETRPNHAKIVSEKHGFKRTKKGVEVNFDSLDSAKKNAEQIIGGKHKFTSKQRESKFDNLRNVKTYFESKEKKEQAKKVNDFIELNYSDFT
jgi:hypothetical protein